MEKKWIAFDHEGVELMRLTIKGTFEGEIESTRELLAYERGLAPEDIKIELR